MSTKSTTGANTGALEEKKSRRDLLALVGAGGAAALAAAVGGDSTADASSTTVFYVGKQNAAAPGAPTTLAANVNSDGLAALNVSPGDAPAGVAGYASTLFIAGTVEGDRSVQTTRERLRDLRFFMNRSALPRSGDDGITAQGAPVGNGAGVFGFGDFAGVLGSGFIGTAGVGGIGALGLSEGGGPGVAGASDTGPGVWGDSDRAPGVTGTSNRGRGVSGASNTGIGVRGDGKTGVRGHASGSGKVGVHATAANRAVALKVEGGPMILPKLSASKRNSLSAVNGMLIYNTSVHRVQARVNGRWVNL